MAKYNPQILSLLCCPPFFFHENSSKHDEEKRNLSDRVFLSSSMELAMNFASTDEDSKISIRNQEETFVKYETLLSRNENVFSEGKEFTSQSQERADALLSVLNEMKNNQHKENLQKNNLVVKTILALKVDFLNQEALSITSETGPMISSSSNTNDENHNFSFVEDQERINQGKDPACCYSYFHVDSLQPCYGLLRDNEKNDYRLTTLAKIHFVVAE
jgi:hypothetical protein